MFSAHMLVTLEFSYHTATMSPVFLACTWYTVPLKITVIVCIYNIHLDYAEMSNAIYTLPVDGYSVCMNMWRFTVSPFAAKVYYSRYVDMKENEQDTHISTVEETARYSCERGRIWNAGARNFFVFSYFRTPMGNYRVAETLSTAKSRGRARIMLLRFVLNA